MARQRERLASNWLELGQTNYFVVCSYQSSQSRILAVLWLTRSDLPGSGLAPKLVRQWLVEGGQGLGVICHD